MSYKKVLNIVILTLVLILFNVLKGYSEKIFFFLNLINYSDIKAELTLKSILVNSKGINTKLNLKHRLIKTWGNFGQYYLGSVEVSDKFIKLKIEVENVKINKKDLRLKNKNLFLPLSLKGCKQKKLVIFLGWDVKASLEGKKPELKWNIYISKKPRIENLLLVLDKENEGIWMIDENYNRVLYFMEIKGRPVYMVKNPDTHEVYVLCSGDRTVKIINAKTLRIEKVFSIGNMLSPEIIVRGEDDKGIIISPQDRKIVLLNFETGSMEKIVYTGFEPEWGCYIPSIGNYFLLSSSENALYIYDSSLNLIDKKDFSFFPSIIFTDGEVLYAGDDSGNLFVLDPVSISVKGQISGICNGISRGKLVKDRIYVCCKDGNLFYFYKKQRYFYQVISGKGSFYEIAYFPSQEWIYVTAPEEEKVAVVDYFKDDIRGYIELGGAGYEAVSLP